MSWYCLSLCLCLLWACKYIQCTDLACHARFQESFIGSKCCPSLHRVHIGVPMPWSPDSSSFRCRVVAVIETPLCSLNNVNIVQPHRVCRLASLLDVTSNYIPLVSIKRLFSVPKCCVLPEDLISGLAMHSKPVALSQGATMLGIRAALTVGHARLPTR